MQEYKNFVIGENSDLEGNKFNYDVVGKLELLLYTSRSDFRSWIALDNNMYGVISSYVDKLSFGIAPLNNQMCNKILNEKEIQSTGQIKTSKNAKARIRRKNKHKIAIDKKFYLGSKADKIKEYILKFFKNEKALYNNSALLASVLIFHEILNECKIENSIVDGYRVKNKIYNQHFWISIHDQEFDIMKHLLPFQKKVTEKSIQENIHQMEMVENKTAFHLVPFTSLSDLEVNNINMKSTSFSIHIQQEYQMYATGAEKYWKQFSEKNIISRIKAAIWKDFQISDL